VDPDLQVRMAVYEWFARTGRRPGPADLAARIGLEPDTVVDACRRLRVQRMLVLETDDATIRMAPPFSGVTTQHIVEVGGVRYFANCAWDALGIPAALHAAGTVVSCGGDSREPLRLEVGLDGPAASDWLFHCVVPAAHWWDDIVFT